MSILKPQESDSGGGLPKDSSAEKLQLTKLSAFSMVDVADVGLDGKGETEKEDKTLAESRRGNVIFGMDNQDDEEEKKDPSN
jgi:hypothetical protein